MSKPKILFIHQNFPAQFGAIGGWLSKQGWDVTFATARTEDINPGYRILKFKNHRDVSKGIHRYLVGTEQAVIAGQGFARTAIEAAKAGYRPDIVMAHSGWGVGTFAKDVWPDAKFIPYVEWWYRWPAVDRSQHDLPSKEPVDERARTRVRNTPMLLDLMAADQILCPTQFQADQFPEIWRDKITVLHDGIDTDLIVPGERDKSILAKHKIPVDAEIVTYVARGMEPQRGFPEMMRAASILQKKRPNLNMVIVGKDRIAYGNKSASESWKDKLLSELPFDHSRLHFTGLLPRSDLNRVFQMSDAHLYLSVPFVLSWSSLEAMSAGCHLVAADNAPVHEFMEDGKTATLVDPYVPQKIAEGVEKALDDKERAKSIRTAARQQIVQDLDAKTVIFPEKERMFAALLG